ncbi:hypothetical protein BMR02_01860 [Methylococcaceae bacterium HT1]|nr:hypothetical protein BMR02_01860 [Methylococcaceae bacterium HT1]
MTTSDNQHVLNLFTQHASPMTIGINRRSFCRLTGLSFFSLFLPACSQDTSLQAIRQEDEFKLFFEVIFPASDLGLKDYRDTALLRIQRLTGKDAEVIIQI